MKMYEMPKTGQQPFQKHFDVHTIQNKLKKKSRNYWFERMKPISLARMQIE